MSQQIDHLVSSATAIPTPAMIPTNHEKSGLEKLREATPDVVMPLALNRNNHPHAKFWEEHEWEQWAREEKEEGMFKSGMQGEGVNSSWMENAMGERVDIARQQKILKEAHRTWVTMKCFGIELIVLGGMAVTSLDYFHARMELKFPELQLCADHWKVDRIWTENFSSWAYTYKQAKKASQSGPQSEKACGFHSLESTF